MGGYIGARAGSLSTTTVANVQDVTATDTTPEVTIINNTHEDTDGGREGKVIFKGQQSGGEESTLAEIQGSHDGTADDEKGDLIFRTNDGSDGATPTERVRIDSNGSILTATLGTDNVHLGEGAGASIASGGTNNVTVGKDAGTALTTGDNNIAIGYEALKTEDAHSNNTAVGYQALKTQNAGANAANTAIGYQAGLDLTDGHSEVFVGTLAGSNVTTGDYNTLVGYSAGQSVTTGEKNTALGAQALDAATTGFNNTAIGWDALTANTVSGAHVAVGYQALESFNTSNNSSEFNVAVGTQAGKSLTTGTYNTFIGPQAGFNITTGSKNTILGQFDGNAHSVDIRTSSNNIVLSDGDGKPRAYYGVAATPHWFIENDQTQWIASMRNSHSSGPYGLLIHYTATAPNGNANEFLYCFDTVGGKMLVKSNGNVVNQNNSYGAISDLKLKENIADASSQWDDIKALQIKKYSMKVDELDAPNKLGVIAQDLEAAGMSGLVEETQDRDSEGAVIDSTTKSVKYSILYMKAIKALQEAMTKIETLETQNTTQATQIADLITRVEALEGA